MSLGYFVMPLHPRGSDPACTLSGPLHGVSARNDLRSFPLPGGEHREVIQEALETILALWQI